MSISILQPYSEFRAPPQVNCMMKTLNSFPYTAPKLLLSFLALQSTAFAGSAGNPFQTRECPLIGDFNPQDTTAVWTNEIGQYTLNPRDTEGSYQSYTEAFAAPLTECIKEMNNLASEASNAAEQALEHSLTTSVYRYVPQELQLDSALRNPNKLIDYSSDATSLEQRERLSALSNKALEILRKWYPGDEISIHTLKLIDASLGDKNRNLTLHIDSIYHAGLTLPASEYPLVKNEIWITKKGEKVCLENINEATGEIEVTILETPNSVSGKTATLKDSDLDYHACVSGKTTQIVPGLVSNQSPNVIFDQRNLVQPNTPIRRNADQLLKFAIQLPYQSSLLFLGDQLVHSVPPYQSESNSPALKNCTEIYRKRLAIFYERNSKRSSFSELGESTYRLLTFFSKHPGPIIDSACILVFLFAARVFTMPAI